MVYQTGPTYIPVISRYDLQVVRERDCGEGSSGAIIERDLRASPVENGDLRGFIWDLYGIYMRFIWDLYGIYMGYLGFIWGFNGNNMEIQSYNLW